MLLFLLIISAILFVLYRAYVSDITRLLAETAAERRIADTAQGPIAYTSEGDGPALLVVHGWGGGGAGRGHLFSFLAQHGFRVITVSRPGYLGTPLRVGETMEAQADALAALLDALDLPSAAVACGSGGAPTSVLFALRHPARCWGLVLVSALTRPDPIVGKSAVQKFLEQGFQSGFFIWVISTFFWRSLIESGMGQLNASIRQDPEKVAALRQLTRGLILSSRCREGLANDMRQWAQMPRYPLDQIRTPTLIVHSRNDVSVPFHIAEFTATIPNAQPLIFDDGGHTCYIVHSEVTHPATVAFLKKHQPSEPKSP